MRLFRHAKWALVLIAALAVVAIYDGNRSWQKRDALGPARVAPVAAPDGLRNAPTLAVADKSAVPIPDPARDESTHVVADKASIDAVVTANGDFATDLYDRLASESPGKNLFFSPYSVSMGLTMVAEGARGETAEQMGRVLRFPDAARQRDNDAVPWKMAMIHTGIAGLSDQSGHKPVPRQLADRIAAMRAVVAAEAKKRADEEKKQAEPNAATNPADRLDFSTGLSAFESSDPTPTQRLNQLLIEAQPYELSTANALWGDKAYPFEPSFVETINKYYGAGGVFSLDFRNNAEGARQQINTWALKQTNQHIKDFIPAGAVGDLTRLVLTNTIYFRGAWTEPFHEAATAEDDFFLANGTKVRVPMMHKADMERARYAAFNPDGSFFATPLTAPIDPKKRDEKLFYPAHDGFVMAELAYKGNDLSMVVILPREAGGLPPLERMLSQSNLRKWISQLQNWDDLDVFLPKFKLQESYEMNKTLEAMGMVRAFDPSGTAQFEGLCAGHDSDPKLYLQAVIHNTYVDVNEKGTEATADTGISMMALDASTAFTPVFRTDKPFIFAIRDIKTGTILFLGRVMNPKE